jgi:hypothetical protein
MRKDAGGEYIREGLSNARVGDGIEEAHRVLLFHLGNSMLERIIVLLEGGLLTLQLAHLGSEACYFGSVGSLVLLKWSIDEFLFVCWGCGQVPRHAWLSLALLVDATIAHEQLTLGNGGLDEHIIGRCLLVCLHPVAVRRPYSTARLQSVNI